MYSYKDKEFPDGLDESKITGNTIRTWNPIKFYRLVKFVLDINKGNHLTVNSAINEIKDIFKDEPEIAEHIINMAKKI